MDKQKFLDLYSDRILVHFNYTYFLSDDDLLLQEKTIRLKDFLEFYTPWHQKDGLLATDIKQVLEDENYKILKINEAKNFAYKWNDHLQPEVLWEVPIATDTSLGKTLLLDSNRTICSRIFKYKFPFSENIKVFEITGPRLKDLNTDFQILTKYAD